MLYRLIFLSGPRTGERITATEDAMLLGADPDCTVSIADPEMARKHAAIEQRDDELFIRDLGSMNKILVNKREVHEARLKHGDEIELGRTRLLVQALVQAEVGGNGGARRRRRRVARAVAALLILGAAAYLLARPARHKTTSLPAAPPPTAATAATVAATADAPSSNVTEDLRGLREDILAIQQSVESLAAKPASPPPTAPPPGPRTPREDAEELLASARAAIAAQHPEEADQLLAQIQRIDPDFLPAYEERAQLFEQRGRKGEAAAQWSEILRRSVESPLYQRAVAERIRISQQASAAPVTDQPVLAISQAQLTRFQSTDDYDEMRVLNIFLAPTQPGLRIDRDAVRVDVTFFDRDTAFGEVAPTKAQVSQEDLKPTAAWGRASDKAVAATYLVPKGLRAQQELEGRPMIYHGYRVRVFYHDRLQDETAMPHALIADGAASNKTAVATPSPARTTNEEASH